VATEAQSKIIPVLALGPRTLDMAMGVVHDLVGTMSLDCLPIFTADGLSLYFYALTAHFGRWIKGAEGVKPNWQVAAELIYGQVKKIVRRRRLVRVEHKMLLGEPQNLKDRLQRLGFSGRINTAFIERLNLTIRQGVSLLVRRTWGRAKYSPELKLHILWWRGIIISCVTMPHCGWNSRNRSSARGIKDPGDGGWAGHATLVSA
jgi:hypothetical protein